MLQFICSGMMAMSLRSKLGVWDRWLETVYMPGCTTFKLRQMYEAMDLLHEHAEQIEQQVFYQVANLLNFSVDIIFYDTTTPSFAVDYEDEEDGLRQYGHRKEGTWIPHVVVALAVTREGIPVKSWVFPGNTADVSTVETIKKDLRGLEPWPGTVCCRLRGKLRDEPSKVSQSLRHLSAGNMDG